MNDSPKAPEREYPEDMPSRRFWTMILCYAIAGSFSGLGFYAFWKLGLFDYILPMGLLRTAVLICLGLGIIGYTIVLPASFIFQRYRNRPPPKDCGDKPPTPYE